MSGNISGYGRNASYRQMRAAAQNTNNASNSSSAQESSSKGVERTSGGGVLYKLPQELKDLVAKANSAQGCSLQEILECLSKFKVKYEVSDGKQKFVQFHYGTLTQKIRYNTGVNPTSGSSSADSASGSSSSNGTKTTVTYIPQAKSKDGSNTVSYAQSRAIDYSEEKQKFYEKDKLPNGKNAFDIPGSTYYASFASLASAERISGLSFDTSNPWSDGVNPSDFDFGNGHVLGTHDQVGYDENEKANINRYLESWYSSSEQYGTGGTRCYDGTNQKVYFNEDGSIDFYDKETRTYTRFERTETTNDVVRMRSNAVSYAPPIAADYSEEKQKFYEKDKLPNGKNAFDIPGSTYYASFASLASAERISGFSIDTSNPWSDGVNPSDFDFGNGHVLGTHDQVGYDENEKANINRYLESWYSSSEQYGTGNTRCYDGTNQKVYFNEDGSIDFYDKETRTYTRFERSGDVTRVNQSANNPNGSNAVSYAPQRAAANNFAVSANDYSNTANDFAVGKFNGYPNTTNGFGVDDKGIPTFDQNSLYNPEYNSQKDSIYNPGTNYGWIEMDSLSGLSSFGSVSLAEAGMVSGFSAATYGPWADSVSDPSFSITAFHEGESDRFGGTDLRFLDIPFSLPADAEPGSYGGYTYTIPVQGCERPVKVYYNADGSIDAYNPNNGEYIHYNRQ